MNTLALATSIVIVAALSVVKLVLWLVVGAVVRHYRWGP